MWEEASSLGVSAALPHGPAQSNVPAAAAPTPPRQQRPPLSAHPPAPQSLAASVQRAPQMKSSAFPRLLSLRTLAAPTPIALSRSLSLPSPRPSCFPAGRPPNLTA